MRDRGRNSEWYGGWYNLKKYRTMKLIDITIRTILREISRTTFPLKETRYRGNTKEDYQSTKYIILNRMQVKKISQTGN